MISEKAKKNMAALQTQARINADSNTNAQAYETYALYDSWEEIPENTFLKEGKKVGYKGILYAVNAPGHNKQANWAPDTAVSLFIPIPKDDEGGIDNPIVWVSGMVSEKDKYYADAGVTYLCIESSGVGLYAQPKDLPRYFQPIG